MGKRPQQNKGKKKGGKRSRVQRDYDEGLDDEVVEQHIPSGPRKARSTQKKVEASIATWERVKEAQFHQQQRARFAKPPPPEKPKGLTKAQRRARRRRELRGPATERAWPTRKQLSAAARARSGHWRRNRCGGRGVKALRQFIRVVADQVEIITTRRGGCGRAFCRRARSPVADDVVGSRLERRRLLVVHCAGRLPRFCAAVSFR